MEREYLPLSQELFNEELYLSVRFDAFRAFQDLIISAHTKDKLQQHKNKGHKVKLQRGQTWVSKKYLASRWKWKRETVSNFLSKMVDEDYLKVESVGKNGNEGCIITILDFSRFYRDGSLEINVEEQIENIPPASKRGKSGTLTPTISESKGDVPSIVKIPFFA